MNILEIILLAVALSLDAMIVSFSYGMVINADKIKNALILSSMFAVFQTIMPIMGWNFTKIIYEQLKIYSKWIVFVIFMFLAIKFIKESVNEKINIKKLNIMVVIGLAIATSIDAFGAGISLRFLNTNIIYVALIIGMVTFVLSLIGFYSAEIFRNCPAKILGITGSLLLIYLAVKTII